jgi:hypothetical protein
VLDSTGSDALDDEFDDLDVDSQLP